MSGQNRSWLCCSRKSWGGGLSCHDLRRSTSNFLADLFWMLIRVDAFSLRKPGGNSTCPVFNLRVPSRVGANRRVCITAFWYLKMTQNFFLYVLLLRKMKTEDRHSVWFCSSCNGMADRITVCWVFWMDWTLCFERNIGTGGLLNGWIFWWKEW